MKQRSTSFVVGVVSLCTLCLLGPLPRSAHGDDPPILDPSYQAKISQVDAADVGTLVELAGWCREQGLVREMLRTVGTILEREPDNELAHRLVARKREGDSWAFTVPPLAHGAEESANAREIEKAREKLLQKARKQTFKMAKQATRFDFWSDVERGRLQSYAKVMNRYYDRTRGYFGSTESKTGIPVLVFSKRSEYQRFYSRVTGKSGEHVRGFFASTKGGRFLCFFDDAYDDDDGWNTAKHECTHLLIKQSMSGAHLPLWLEEGFACFLAANEEERFGEYVAQCFLTVRRGLLSGSGIPIRELMSTPQKDFDFRHYAASWSWVSFLTANPETRKKVPRLFFGLRRIARERDTSSWSVERWAKEGNRLFEEVFGAPGDFEQPWRLFAMEELAPESAAQKLDAASVGLAMARGRWKADPPLAAAERRDLLRESEQWLGDAAKADDPNVAARARIARIAALITRADTLDYDEIERTHCALEARSTVDSYLSEPESVDHAAELAGVVLEALALIGRSSDYDTEPGDLVGLPDRIDSRSASLAEKESLGDEEAAWIRDFLRLQKRVAEDLILEARVACQRALAKDPGHRPAVFVWFLIALEFAPEDLDRLFPHLLFQVELDPDDVSLAALAAAYAVMGKPAHAQQLLARAKAISPRPGRLERFVTIVEEAGP